MANHEDENCLCGKCKCELICYLKDKSRNCHGRCVKDYGHKSQHLCDLNEKEHLCNKECIYKGRTRGENGGCLEKCKLPYDHEGENHICENPKEKHICNKECSLINDSFPESCNKLCNKSIDHEPPCLCINKPEKHICNKICHLNDKKDIRGCKSFCSLPVHHKEECLCSAGYNGHLCSKECSLFTKSREGCNKKCNLPYNHNGECFCSSDKKEHKCNKTCSLKENTREGCCLKECKNEAGHSGPCLCLLSKENHFCNKSCSLKEKSREGSCTGKCALNTGHDGECICSSDKHICNHECDYKKSSSEGCFGICSKETNHEGEHKCMKEKKEHKCNQMCHYSKVSRNCKEYCKRYLGHEGNHLCDENLIHLCSGDCYLSKICHKGFKFCSKPAGHKDGHDCLEEKEHICNKECSLKDKSRGCLSKCSLRYDHKKLDNTDCICTKTKNEHLCTKICEFCKGDIHCGFVCDHNNNGHHFCCDREHDCEGTCEQDGICVIEPGLNIKKKRVQVLQFSRESIEFEDKDEQEKIRLRCKIKIPKNEYMHEGKHKCELKIHKCGFICRQCDRMCELEYGHFDENKRKATLHKCNHGHINNANILTKENSVKLLYQNNFYNFINEESPNIFTCYNYCKQQGRGHIHIIEQSHLDKVKNINTLKEYFRIREDGLYECKCEFFWEYILNFQFDEEFDDKQIKSFTECPAYCPLCEEIDINKKTYCDGVLWHETFNDSNNDKDYWISEEGHRFKCHHPIPCHTIFIIDKSGSMAREDIQPNLPNICKNKDFNNRMGRLIESMNNYISRRKKISQKDLFSVISFSEKAEIILSGNSCDSTEEFDFVEECMKKIKKCEGDTEFYLGFEKSKEILDSIDRTKYKPVIILFSDGADEKDKETIKIIKEVSILYFLFFYKI